MPPNHRPGHFVVDGSNIATEGRSVPSLEQLNEAVLAFAADHPDVLLTVVVDATFGHRIDKSEVAEFDEAVANNELVAPPAGAVGRGDAFVLTIADKAGAGVLSNDSFQEFHGQYEWLFDEGRLVGGKPVPYVGWVFVDRTPVRGPKSRQAVKAAKSAGGRPSKRAAKSAGSPVAATPEEAVAAKEMAKARIRPRVGGAATSTSAPSAPDSPGTTVEPTGSARGSRRTGRSKASGRQPDVGQDGADNTGGTSAGQASATRSVADAPGGYVNELMPFLNFVADNPVGTVCDGTIDNYASHGAYARVGDVNVYLPLRLMGSPPPRSARSVVNVGDAVTVEIAGFVPARRSVDAALVSVANQPIPEADGAVEAVELEAVDPPTAATRGRGKAAGKPASESADSAASPRNAPAGKRRPSTPSDDSPQEPKSRSRASSSRQKDPAPQAPAALAASETSSVPVTARPAKKAAAKKAAAKEAAPEKPAAKKAAAKKAAPKKAAPKKAAPKKAAPATSLSRGPDEAAIETADSSVTPKPSAKRSAARSTRQLKTNTTDGS